MTAYSLSFDSMQEGQLADCTQRRIDTSNIELNTVTELAFGIPVMRRSSPNKGLIPWYSSTPISGTTGRVFGITVLDPTKTGGKYVGTGPVNVLTIGRVCVYAQVEVNVGDKAYVEEGTGLFTNLPENEDEESNTEIGVWMSDTGAISDPTLAVISINLEAITLTS